MHLQAEVYSLKIDNVNEVVKAAMLPFFMDEEGDNVNAFWETYKIGNGLLPGKTKDFEELSKIDSAFRCHSFYDGQSWHHSQWMEDIDVEDDFSDFDGRIASIREILGNQEGFLITVNYHF